MARDTDSVVDLLPDHVMDDISSVLPLNDCVPSVYNRPKPDGARL